MTFTAPRRTEFGRRQFLNKTLKQINYHLHHTSGLMNIPCHHEVMDELIELIDKLQEEFAIITIPLSMAL
ncbi:MAG: hypothetical protein R2784_02155 [Saprospiraceae bacterium]